MSTNRNAVDHYLALDVGEKRIGVAYAESQLKLPVIKTTLQVDGTEKEKLAHLIHELGITVIVVGLPRNQQGEETQQSKVSRVFAEELRVLTGLRVELQDESLTSVLAEQRLKASGKPYSKPDIDAAAAAIILSDYLGVSHAA